ncbi:MAG: hypothetical protein AB7G06_04205 [Bdellovibrionales bacterium]
MNAPYNRQYSIALLSHYIAALENADRFSISNLVMFNGEKQGLFKRLQHDVAEAPTKTHLVYLSRELSGSQHLHAVALSIDPSTRAISFQDPYGTKADAEMREALEKTFPGFSFTDSAGQQQYDATSCAVITVDNLVRMARGIPLQERPDVAALCAAHARDLDPATILTPKQANPFVPRDRSRKFDITSC